MTAFKCPECGRPLEFSSKFTSEGCIPVKKCLHCHVYVELTSDTIVSGPAADLPAAAPASDRSNFSRRQEGARPRKS